MDYTYTMASPPVRVLLADDHPLLLAGFSMALKSYGIEVVGEAKTPEEAIEQYRRRRFLEGLNQDFKALKEDREAWQEELEERKMWDKTLLDGEEK